MWQNFYDPVRFGNRVQKFLTDLETIFLGNFKVNMPIFVNSPIFLKYQARFNETMKQLQDGQVTFDHMQVYQDTLDTI